MFRIERAAAEDAESLRQVGVQAFAEDAEKYGGSPSGVDLVENHREWIKQYHYYKIVLEDEIIGGMIVMPGDECYSLGALFILPAFQNRGIGTRAIGFIERTYASTERWALCAPYLNYRVHRFYEKLGYEKVGETNPGDHPEMADKRFYLLLFEKRMIHQPGGNP